MRAHTHTHAVSHHPFVQVMSEATATGVSEVDVQSPCAVCGMEVPLVYGRSGLGKEVCPQGHPVGKGNTLWIEGYPWVV